MAEITENTGVEPTAKKKRSRKKTTEDDAPTWRDVAGASQRVDVIGHGNEDLECVLSPEEEASLEKELRRLRDRHYEVWLLQQEANKTKNREREILHTIRSKRITRTIPFERILDGDRVYYVRLDTGERYKSEIATSQDRQLLLSTSSVRTAASKKANGVNGVHEPESLSAPTPAPESQPSGIEEVEQPVEQEQRNDDVVAEATSTEQHRDFDEVQQPVVEEDGDVFA